MNKTCKDSVYDNISSFEIPEIDIFLDFWQVVPYMTIVKSIWK